MPEGQVFGVEVSQVVVVAVQVEVVVQTVQVGLALLLASRVQH